MSRFALTILLALLSLLCQAQRVFRLDSLPANGTLLNKGWTFHAGDNPAWAKPDVDDSTWEPIDPTKDIFELPQISKTGQIGWLRIKLSIANPNRSALSISLQQVVASEIYLNGRLIHRIGYLSPDSQRIKAVNPNRFPYSLPVTTDSVQTLAIRYAFQPNIRYATHFGRTNPLFSVTLYPTDEVVLDYTHTYNRDQNLNFAAVWVILSLLFFTLYIFFPVRKAHLYFSVYTLLFAISWYLLSSVKPPAFVESFYWRNNASVILETIGYLFMLNAVYATFQYKKGLFYWAMVPSGIVAIFSGALVYNWGWLLFGFFFNNFINIDITRVSLIAVRQQRRGAWILLAGGICYLVCWFVFSLQFFSIINLGDALGGLLFDISILSISVAFAVFLAYDFGLTSRVLQQKLQENEALFAEKQQILATQNDTLEQQVAERTAELEQKNRELVVETSLERVRSRTMVMQQSAEVLDVADTLYDELQHLGFAYGACTIQIMDDATGDMKHWVAGFAHKQYPQSYHIPHFDNPCYAAQFNAWRNGETYLVYTLAGEEKKAYDAAMFTRTDYRNFPEQEKQRMTEAESVLFSIAYMKHGALHWRPGPLTNEQATILQRFAQVFEQAYTRFLDLQKAEAQVREAQIEAALERIRARTIAMRQSEDLLKVITLVGVELQQLDIPFTWVNIVTDFVFEEGINSWLSIPGLQDPIKLYVPYLDHVFFHKTEVLLPTGAGFWSYSMNADERKVWFDHVFNKTVLKAYPEEFKQERIKVESYHISTAILKNNVVLSLAILGGVAYTEEQNDVIKRFGNVFDQTYTRYLDLQKAETSAKEAIRQSSLDRVRAEIASMRTVGDLQRITPIIWHELIALGISFIRCGVFIMDDPAQEIHTFLSTPDGNAIASFHLDYAVSQPITDVVAHWHHNQRYTSHWGHEAFTALADSLRQQGGVAAREQYLAGLPDEGIYPHFLPFRQGMLYVGNTQRLTDDELQVVQSVADAFATAYARYEDFNRLEAAKQQVDNTLVELKQTQQQLIQKEKLASLGELTAGIAHEIQNPLNFVNNFAEVSAELVSDLKDELAKGDTAEVNLLADDLRQNLEKISHHGQRASSIVRGMLEHSRTNSGERQPTNLNVLTDEYLRLTYQGLKAKDKIFQAELVMNVAPDLPLVSVMPPDLGRVLLNLFNNAFYAVREKQKTAPADYQPTVSVSTRLSGKSVEIGVQDNGTGIPDAVKAKIFQPFFTTKPTGEGTGLGLSLSYDIVTKGHGGSLTVASMEGEGTTFIVTIPV